MPSLFFEKLAVLVHVLVIWVDSDETTSSFIFQTRLLDHHVVGALYFSGRSDWEGALLVLFVAGPAATYTIQLLLEHFREERSLHDSARLKVLTACSS